MRKIIVKTNKTTNKISLTNYICDIFKNVPYSYLCKSLRNKDIRINDVKVNKDVIIKNGDIIDIYISDDVLFNLPKNIEYYYNDDNIIIAYKNQGLLSNLEETLENSSDLIEPTFEDLVKKDLGNKNIRICHRLDRNTSGLVIFTKNTIAYNEILNGFKNNNIKKEYIAYVSGSHFNKTNDTLEGYLVKDDKTAFSKVYRDNAKDSEKVITEYTVLETDKVRDYAKLNVILHTGKTHQIRAHLASINHPIIGDSKYFS